MTIRDMKCSVNNMKVSVELMIHRNKNIVNNDKIKPHLLASLQNLSSNIEKMGKARLKNEVTQLYKETTKVFNTIKLMVENTDTFLSMLSMIE